MKTEGEKYAEKYRERDLNEEREIMYGYVWMSMQNETVRCPLFAPLNGIISPPLASLRISTGQSVVITEEMVRVPGFLQLS